VSAPAPAVKRRQVVPQPGSRLEQLQAQYDMLEAAAKEAASRFEDLKMSIKTEATRAAVGAGVIDIPGSGSLPPLTVRWKEAWHFNTALCKDEDPYTYARFAERKGRWELGRGKAS